MKAKGNNKNLEINISFNSLQASCRHAVIIFFLLFEKYPFLSHICAANSFSP